MNQQIKTRLKRTALLCGIALAIGAGLGLAQINAAKHNENAVVTDKGSTPDAASPVAGVAVGGPFTLTDQNGKIVTEKTYSGQYKIVYFGFTNCPMICPTGLQKIAKVLNMLGPAGDNIQPILITVDPERDTPDVLRQYVQQFHPRLVGLTGTKADIENVEKSYRVYAAKVENKDLSDYTMDHSAFIYLMSPDDQLLTIYRDADTAETIADDIKKQTQN